MSFGWVHGKNKRREIKLAVSFLNADNIMLFFFYQRKRRKKNSTTMRRVHTVVHFKSNTVKCIAHVVAFLMHKYRNTMFGMWHNLIPIEKSKEIPTCRRGYWILTIANRKKETNIKQWGLDCDISLSNALFCKHHATRLVFVVVFKIEKWFNAVHTVSKMGVCERCFDLLRQWHVNHSDNTVVGHNVTLFMLQFFILFNQLMIFGWNWNIDFHLKFIFEQYHFFFITVCDLWFGWLYYFN